MNVLRLAQTISAESPQGLGTIDNRITFKTAERDFQGFPKSVRTAWQFFMHQCVLAREMIFWLTKYPLNVGG